MGIFEEWHQLHAIAFLDVEQRHLVGIKPHLRAVGEVELPSFTNIVQPGFEPGV